MLQLKSATQILRDVVARMVAASGLSYFGQDSAEATIAEAVTSAARVVEADLLDTYRRTFLSSSDEDTVTEIALELGVDKLPAQRATVYCVFVPETSNVVGISGVGPYVLTVDGYGGWQIGDSIRVKGSTNQETVSVSGTGVGTITVASLTYAASYSSDISAGQPVLALFRANVPVGSTINFQGGLQFQTLDAVTTGDANPLLKGEGTSLALVDKAWCECTTVGAQGNVDRLTATGLSVAIRGVNRIFNPLAGENGADTENATQLKRRVAQEPLALARTQLISAESLAKRATRDVLRLSLGATTSLSTVVVNAISRSLAPLSSDKKTAVAAYLEARAVPGVTYTVADMPITAVELYFNVTLVSKAGETTVERQRRLRSLWAEILSVLSEYIDASTYALGGTVLRSKLIDLVLKLDDIKDLDTTSALPATDITADTAGVPRIGLLILTDSESGYTIGDGVTQVY